MAISSVSSTLRIHAAVASSTIVSAVLPPAAGISPATSPAESKICSSRYSAAVFSNLNSIFSPTWGPSGDETSRLP